MLPDGARFLLGNFVLAPKRCRLEYQLELDFNAMSALTRNSGGFHQISIISITPGDSPSLYFWSAVNTRCKLIRVCSSTTQQKAVYISSCLAKHFLQFSIASLVFLLFLLVWQLPKTFSPNLFPPVCSHVLDFIRWGQVVRTCLLQNGARSPHLSREAVSSCDDPSGLSFRWQRSDLRGAWEDAFSALPSLTLPLPPSWNPLRLLSFAMLFLFISCSFLQFWQMSIVNVSSHWFMFFPPQICKPIILPWITFPLPCLPLLCLPFPCLCLPSSPSHAFLSYASPSHASASLPHPPLLPLRRHSWTWTRLLPRTSYSGPFKTFVHIIIYEKRVHYFSIKVL